MDYTVLERIRLDEIKTLNEVILVCRDVLKNPICLEQAKDAKEELDLALKELDKLVATLKH